MASERKKQHEPDLVDDLDDPDMALARALSASMRDLSIAPIPDSGSDSEAEDEAYEEKGGKEEKKIETKTAGRSPISIRFGFGRRS